MAYYHLNKKDCLMLENQPAKNSSSFPYNIKKVQRTFIKNKKYQPSVLLARYNIYPKKKHFKKRVKTKNCPLLESLDKGNYSTLLVDEDPVIYNSEDLLNDLLTSSEDEDDYFYNLVKEKKTYLDNKQENKMNSQSDNVIYIKSEVVEDCLVKIETFDGCFIKSEAIEDCKHDIEIFHHPI
jgi:hypothetical protein